eukprot:6196322-Amphidinium_carterae.1
MALLRRAERKTWRQRPSQACTLGIPDEGSQKRGLDPAGPRLCESHSRLGSRREAVTTALRHRSIHHARQPLPQRAVHLAERSGFVVRREGVLCHREGGHSRIAYCSRLSGPGVFTGSADRGQAGYAGRDPQRQLSSQILCTASRAWQAEARPH